MQGFSDLVSRRHWTFVSSVILISPSSTVKSDVCHVNMKSPAGTLGLTLPV